MGAGLVVANRHGDLWFGYRGRYGWFLGGTLIFGGNVKSVGLRLWQNVAGSTHHRASHVGFPVGGEDV